MHSTCQNMTEQGKYIILILIWGDPQLHALFLSYGLH